MNDGITDFPQTIIAFPEEAQAPCVKIQQEKYRHSCRFLNEEAANANVLSKGSSLLVRGALLTLNPIMTSCFGCL